MKLTKQYCKGELQKYSRMMCLHADSYNDNMDYIYFHIKVNIATCIGICIHI